MMPTLNMIIKNMTFFELTRCWVGYHDYDNRTKITDELQLLFDCIEMIKQVTFFKQRGFAILYKLFI